MENTSLQVLDEKLQQAIELLESAKNISDAKAVVDISSVYKMLVKKAELSKQAQNKAAEIHIYAQRKAGEFLLVMNKNTGAMGTGSNQYEVRLHDETTPPTYNEIGINKRDAHQWQTIATMPEDELIDYLDKCKDNNLEITTSGVYKLAKQSLKEIKLDEYAPERKPLDRNDWITISAWNNLNDNSKKHALNPSVLSNSKYNETNDNIEWAAWSWNPVTGCLHNCDYCYARDIANRFYPQKFEPSFYPSRLKAPENTKVPHPRWSGDIGYKGVFVCSMADLFGKWVPSEWIEAVIEQIKSNPQWTFLLLSKFPIRMAEFEYPDNVWLGTSVDRQFTVERAEKAFTEIKQSGFNGVCWLSCEPMLERLTFTSLNMFDWVAMGGASKSTQTPEYRPPFDDIVHLHLQAREAGCKIYHKTNLLERLREYPK